MKPRTLRILALVVAALSLVVVLDRPRRAAVPDGLADRLLADVDVGAITRLRIAAPGAPEVVLERGAKGFALVAPVAAPADRAAVRELEATLESLAFRRRVPAGDAAARGLDDAQALRLTVEREGGAPVTLRLGRAEPSLGRTWLAREDRPGDAYLVDDYFARGLRLGADELRRREPLDVAPDRLDGELVIEVEGRTLVLAGDPACVKIGAGAGCALADAVRVQALLRRLGELRVSRFLPADPPAAAPPVARVSVAGQSFTVGEACPGAPDERVLRSSLGPACIHQELLDALAAEARDELAWVERAPLPWPLASLRSVELSHGERRLRLEREGGGWQIVGEDGARNPADDGATRDFLHDLASFQAVGLDPLPAAAAAPAGAPSLRLRDERGQELVLWTEPGPAKDRAYVRRPGEPLGLLVHADFARLLDPEPVRFRDRAVLDFQASALRAVEVHGRSPGVGERAERGDTLDDWRLIVPAALPVDPAAVAALRDTAAQLTALRAVAARPAPEHGLDPPAREILFEVDVSPADPAAPPPRPRLRLSAPRAADGACHAQRADLPDAPVFLLDAESCAALSRPLATRALWPDDAVPATVTVGGRRFERHGPGWYGPDGARLSDAEAEALVGLVEALAAPAAVVDYDPPRPRVVVEIGFAGGGAPVTLHVASPDYALAGRPVRYRLSSDACERWPTLCRAR